MNNNQVKTVRKTATKKKQWITKTLGLNSFNGPDLHLGFDRIFTNFSIEELNAINRINLQNYYQKNTEKRTIYCLICQLDINPIDVLSHAKNSVHQYNKLFYKFIQKRNAHGNMDYIFFDNRWAVCRFCDDVIFARFSTELCYHIKNDVHSEKKKYCLDRVDRDSYNNLVKKDLQTPPKTHDKKSTEREEENLRIKAIRQSPNDLDQIFSHYTNDELNKVDQIDLRDNGLKIFKKNTSHCSICQVDMKKSAVPSHIKSVAHRCNKLYYNFVQTRNQCGDADYIVLNNNWVSCRYCDYEILPNFSKDLCENHRQNNVHLKQKQYCLDRAAGDSEQVLLKAI